MTGSSASGSASSFHSRPDLEAGLAPATVFESEIVPDLADHLAPAIEELVRDWVRRTGMEGATRVGSWWGPALDEFRATRERTAEEIDIVGIAPRRVVLIGEVRWRGRPMDIGILGEIERFIRTPPPRRRPRGSRVDTSGPDARRMSSEHPTRAAGVARTGSAANP